MASCTAGSEKPKKRGPEMRAPVLRLKQTSVHGLVGVGPAKVRPVPTSVTLKTGPAMPCSISIV